MLIDISSVWLNHTIRRDSRAPEIYKNCVKSKVYGSWKVWQAKGQCLSFKFSSAVSNFSMFYVLFLTSGCG